MKRAIEIFLGLVLACFAALGVYEARRVLQARNDTPALMAMALAKADAQIRTLPPERARMLVAVEDPSFWTNDGTDFFSPGAGMTTMTQALGKLIYFPNGFKPGFQKIELILIAKFATAPMESKTDILRAFTANAYLGHDEQGDVVGFSEGAHRWFGKDLSALSDDEFLSLVAMLPGPGALDPGRHTPANAERVARIKRLIAHQCTPRGVRDVLLQGCAKG
jgi:membrane peptidoglycan carboxypeptidase